MKIVRVETFLVQPRWLFLRIETDNGIVGWGEPVLEGRAETLATLIDELSDVLIGRDPRLINDTWQLIYRNGCYRGGPVLMSAISGIDQALWDIKGKALNVPVHELLGGAVRDRIRSYIWVGGDRPANLIEDTIAAREAGFSMVKMNICEELAMVDTYASVDTILKRLFALREAVGTTMDLAFDFHGRVHAPMARVLVKELESVRPIFIEDPVAPGQLEALTQLSQQTSISLAVGERIHSRAEFKALFEARAAQIINPDPSHMGGISETLRIGAMAEAYDVALAPHCPLGPIALAACLQLDAVCYNAMFQEQSLGIHYNVGSDLLDYLEPDSKFELVAGNLMIPQGPGLGIVVNEDFVREQAIIGHRWRAPIWRHADGSIAEW